MKRVEYIGLMLVGLSLYPLILMTRELLARQRAYGRYSLVRIPTDEPGFTDDALSAQVGAHRVELRDTLLGQGAKRDDVQRSTVQILVDGRDHSFDSEVEVRPFFRDQNRYHSWAHLVRLLDRQEGTEVLAVVQRISPEPSSLAAAWDLPKESLRYRILLITRDGEVREDIVSFKERAHPAYRTVLARYVTPFDIGFYSEVFAPWPSVVYPVTYPWATTLAGLCLLAFGLFTRLRTSQRSMAPKP